MSRNLAMKNSQVLVGDTSIHMVAFVLALTKNMNSKAFAKSVVC